MARFVPIFAALFLHLIYIVVFFKLVFSPYFYKLLIFSCLYFWLGC